VCVCVVIVVVVIVVVHDDDDVPTVVTLLFTIMKSHLENSTFAIVVCVRYDCKNLRHSTNIL